MILILGGPSGAGKSSLGKYLHDEHGFLHVEFDKAGVPPDPVDTAQLRQEWDLFLGKNDASGLLAEVMQPAVITIPACPLFVKGRNVPVGVAIRYVVGLAWACLREFERREQETGQCLPASHWMRNNAPMFEALTEGGIPREWCVDVFDVEAGRRSLGEIVADLV